AIWGYYPGDGIERAKQAFAVENAEGPYQAGSIDHLGIFLPGVNALYYRGGQAWPYKIEPLDAAWVESVIQLVETIPKPDDLDIYKEANVTDEGIRALALAGPIIRDAIRHHNAKELAKGLELFSI